MTHPSQRSSTVLPIMVTGNSSFDNATQHKQYVFTPAGLDLKLTASVLLAVAATVSFVGNLCVLCFTNNEEKKSVRARSSNLTFFIRSLALSDVLGSLIGAPLIVIQMNFDVFQFKRGCITSRLLQMMFPVITIYNLVVIGIERYICACRPTCRPLSLRTVRKAVKGAWLLGFVVTTGFSYPVESIGVDLNSTHYTLICGYDFRDPATRAIQQARTLLTFILPTFILIFTSARIMRMLRIKEGSVGNTHSNDSELLRKWHMRRRKATIQLTVIIIAFMVPYLIYVAYAVFNSIFTPSIEFKTDYTIRAVAGVLVCLNGPVNFVIHLVQLKGFRQTMKGYVVCCEKEYQMDRVQTVRLGRIQEPKAKPPPEVGGREEERRASTSQMRDAEKSDKTKTRRHSL